MSNTEYQAGLAVAAERAMAETLGAAGPDIAAIRARADAATEGPWHAHNTDDRYSMTAYAVSTSESEPTIDGLNEDENDYGAIVALTMLQTPRLACHVAGRWDRDAEFIAAARSDVPALCDHADRLRDRNTALTQEIAALKAEVDRMQEYREVAAIVCVDLDILLESVENGGLSADEMVRQVEYAVRQKDRLIADPVVRSSRYQAIGIIAGLVARQSRCDPASAKEID